MLFTVCSSKAHPPHIDSHCCSIGTVQTRSGGTVFHFDSLVFANDSIERNERVYVRRAVGPND